MRKAQQLGAKTNIRADAGHLMNLNRKRIQAWPKTVPGKKQRSGKSQRPNIDGGERVVADVG